MNKDERERTRVLRDKTDKTVAEVEELKELERRLADGK